MAISTKCIPVKRRGLLINVQTRKLHIKNCHHTKRSLVKHSFEVGHRMNWSMIEIAALETKFRKKRFAESFFINTSPSARNQKSSDIFPNVIKQRLVARSFMI